MTRISVDFEGPTADYFLCEARQMFGVDQPTQEQINQAARRAVQELALRVWLYKTTRNPRHRSAA